jgi:hypothetical protein
VDQDLSHLWLRHLGGGAGPDPADRRRGFGRPVGHSIVGNSVFQLFFHHESAAAEVVSGTFPNVAPYQDMIETFPRPQETGLAEAVLRLPDGAYHAYMLLSDVERKVLLGS